MNGSTAPREPERFDPKKELERTRTQLHNARMHVQLLEAQIKKLEEMSR